MCGKVRKALEEARKKLLLEYGTDGVAIIPQDTWLALGPDGQLQLAEAVGYHAACSSERQTAEQKVTMKSEVGQTLRARVVQIVPDRGNDLLR
jgi:hypothetical protein